MKRLNELFKCDYDTMISGIKTNSKYVTEGDLFVAINGENADRHDFIDDAINNGAVAVVVSKDICRNDIPVIKVRNTNKILSSLCAKFYDNPEKRLKLIAVTGTNGKTTTACILRDMLDYCGYIGTIGAMYKDLKYDLKNTTPDAEEVFKILKSFLDNGCKYVVMEVSSEAILKKRNRTLKYDVVAITNITSDHLNVHKTQKNYEKCKYKLFKKLKRRGKAVLNTDDKRHYKKLKRRIFRSKISYGSDICASLRLTNYKICNDNTIIFVNYKKEIYKINSFLIGKYNIYNIMTAITIMLALECNMDNIVKLTSRISEVAGRSEVLNFGQNYKIVLDYAHTPDALEKILDSLNEVKKGRIITVTGSAGGRDHEKRSLMGTVVMEKSDEVIFTMDDPRYECVDNIIDDLVSISSLSNYTRITDRKEAIFKAFDMANTNDTVLIAGKGRDNYMAIEDKYVEYNDYNVIKEYFDNKKELGG